MKNSYKKTEDPRFSRTSRKRYPVNELLKGCTKKNVQNLIRETAWSLEGGSMGKEIT